MARRVYSILIIFSIGLGFLLFSIKESHSDTFIIVISGLIFTLFSMGTHGLIAHSLKPSAKGGILLYPLLMGVLWAVLFLLFVFFILPLLCTNFTPIL